MAAILLQSVCMPRTLTGPSYKKARARLANAAVVRQRRPRCQVVMSEQAAAFSEVVTPSRRSLLLALSALVPYSLSGVAEAADGRPPVVFVAGSTGQTGQRIVAELRRLGIPVRAGVRDPKKALALGYGDDSGITLVSADVTEGVDRLVAAIGDATDVICATGFSPSFNLSKDSPAAVDEAGTKVREGPREFTPAWHINRTAMYLNLHLEHSPLSLQ